MRAKPNLNKKKEGQPLTFALERFCSCLRASSMVEKFNIPPSMEYNE